MIHWLAADSASQSNNGQWWIPYLALIVPITAAIVAGLFQMRTTRKAPHERLEKLIGIVKDWPVDLPGKETVHQSIELTLREIREIEGHTRPAAVSIPQSPRPYRSYQQTYYRTSSSADLVLWVVGMVVGGACLITITLAVTHTGWTPTIYWIAAGGLITAVYWAVRPLVGYVAKKLRKDAASDNS